MKAKERTIDPEVLEVLALAKVEGPRLTLPEQLDRKLYLKTAEVLEALGGAWSRKDKATVFGEPAEDRIAALLATGTYARPRDLGFFHTPGPLAKCIVALAQIGQGMTVLEPSAGDGALAIPAAERAGFDKTWLFEVDPFRAAGLRFHSPNWNVIQGDFMESGRPTEPFDRCVMNPPFDRTMIELDHVRHAFGMLKPGGRLVAILSPGYTFRQTRKAAEFRDLYAQCGLQQEALPEHSFLASGTDVSTRVVVLKKL